MSVRSDRNQSFVLSPTRSPAIPHLMNGTICPTFAQQLHSGKQQAAIRLQQRQISPIVRGNDFSSGETGAPIQITHPYLLQRRMMLRKFSAAGVMALSPADGGSLKTRRRVAGLKTDLRHTAASLLLMAGTNIKIVQERLEHSSCKLTLDTDLSPRGRDAGRSRN